jgi:hypothetical protein
MPKFITIGWGYQAGYDRTRRPVRDAAHERDARLRSEALRRETPHTPVCEIEPSTRGFSVDARILFNQRVRQIKTVYFAH